MTPLYPTLKKRINDGIDNLIRRQVIPWSFMTVGRPFRIARFDGSIVQYQGIEFEGSPRHVFWLGYIEPFLEDLCKTEIDEAVVLANQKGVDGREVLTEVEGLLSHGIDRVYSEMADVDQRLRGKGYPKSVERRSVHAELSAMKQFVREHIASEQAMWATIPRRESWYRQNQFLVWSVGVSIAILSLLVTVASFARQLW